MPISLASASVETTMPWSATTGSPAPSYRQLAGKRLSEAGGSGADPAQAESSARGAGNRETAPSARAPGAAAGLNRSRRA